MTDQKLADHDRRILEFERQIYRRQAAKDEAILVEFGISPTRYFQTLNRIIDCQAAMYHDPQLVSRLRRIRDTRRASRRLRNRNLGERSPLQSSHIEGI
jgi:hypothetical protein